MGPVNTAHFSKASAVVTSQIFGSWVPAFAGMTNVGEAA